MASDLVLYGVLVLDAAIYLFLFIGYLKTKEPSIPEAIGITEAFQILERSLRRSFVDLPDGFTWNEVINKARLLDLDIDWRAVERVLKQYEAYRYGGVDPGIINTREILKLAMIIPKGTKFDRRS